MFKIITVRDIVRIPPSRFAPRENLRDVALDIVRKEYEDKITGDLGYIITVIEVIDIGTGKLIPGDGAAFHNITFKILVFKPDLHEVVEGEVVEVVDFGVFIRLGPLDGLCHVSQVTDDFITYNAKNASLLGKESGKTLEANDRVRARIVAVSIGTGGSRSGKLGLTMRQPFLGKIEWINEEIDKKLHPEKYEKKKEEASEATADDKSKQKKKKMRKGKK
ncbi:MAG TPA: DNA-directed RNA polymerase [Candidatus Deferrimicrobium sp.]|nr:DNA-directed RNA polymerase [Candidatus Deferrimicrobium sp.]